MSLPLEPLLLLKALALGIVEGLTEFLPISSTGHLILAADLLDFNDAKGKVFEVFIQTGAMLAIIWEYRKRLWNVMSNVFREQQSQRFVIHVAIAFLPAALLGLALGSLINAHLFQPVPVALAFIVGGLAILWAERRDHHERVASVDEMTWVDALKVGCAQCFALIPGTSRSGATIVGGMLFGLSRKAATEFSFFLAIPTLIAAGAYVVVRNRALFSVADVPVVSVGLVASFASAFLCVRWLLRYIAHHNFTIFAWYRIVFGAIVLLTAWRGSVDWTAS